jgi:hypothetical protein
MISLLIPLPNIRPAQVVVAYAAQHLLPISFLNSGLIIQKKLLNLYIWVLNENKFSIFFTRKKVLFDGSDNLCHPGAMLHRKDSASSEWGLSVLIPPPSLFGLCHPASMGYGENRALK